MAAGAKQLREGVELAVRLAELIQNADHPTAVIFLIYCLFCSAAYKAAFRSTPAGG